jgi:hypothetical protein
MFMYILIFIIVDINVEGKLLWIEMRQTFPKVQSVRNFFMNVILNSEALFNIFELCHFFFF